MRIWWWNISQHRSKEVERDDPFFIAKCIKFVSFQLEIHMNSS